MREMKDSGIEWIGEIPKDWSNKAIRYLIDKHISGAWGSDEKHNDNDRVCVRIADFDFPKMRFKENIDYTIRNYSKSEIYNKTLQYGDLLIEKSGGGEKTPVGRTVVYRLDKDSLFANFMDCIRLKAQEYSFEYAKYVFYSLYNRGLTNLYYNQTTGIQNLSMQKYFREVKLPVPSIKEQQKIADFLDKKCSEIDLLHSDIQKQIKILEEYKKSVITEAVTKGLNPNVEMKDSGIEWIGEIPKDWEIIRMQDIGNYKKGPFGSAITKNMFVEKSENTFKVYEQKNAIQKDSKLGHYYIPHSIYEQLKEFMVLPNDIIVSCAGTIGECYILPQDIECGIINQALMRVRLNKNININFFIYIFDIVLEYANLKYSNGSAIKNIPPFSILKKLGIPFPSIVEQQQIADYLDQKCDEIDGAINDKKQQLETLEQYKKSIIYEYVTGKKEVSEDE